MKLPIATYLLFLLVSCSVDGSKEDYQELTSRIIQLNNSNCDDTFIRNDGLYHNDNYGALDQFAIGDRPTGGNKRILIRFSDSLIQSQSEEKVYLELYLLTALYHFNDLIAEVYLIQDETQWVEGTSKFDLALDGVAWKADYPGIESSNPIYDSNKPQFNKPDFIDSVLISETILPSTEGQFYSIEISKAFKLWKSKKYENQGLMIICKREGFPYSNGTRLFASMEHEKPEFRPRLRFEDEK